MDPPSSARGATQTVEAWHHDLPRTPNTGCLRDRSRQGFWQRSPLVAQHEHADPRRPADTQTRRTGSAPAWRVTSTDRTAGCGPACPVVWEGDSEQPSLPPIPILLQPVKQYVN